MAIFTISMVLLVKIYDHFDNDHDYDHFDYDLDYNHFDYDHDYDAQTMTLFSPRSGKTAAISHSQDCPCSVRRPYGAADHIIVMV